MLLKSGDGKFSHWERNRMTISEKIFELLRERGMTQKEFAQATGIAESSISDWKRKKTNPVSEKILIICEVLGVTPYELLSGTEGEGKRSLPSDYLVLDKSTEIGQFVVEIQKMDSRSRERLLGYYYALKEMKS
jgi:transcriptional regulator with XRE-family HTH domain